MPRKEKRFHFIYKTTNVLTGRYYYGMHSTDDLNDGYLGSGKQLRYSIRKYGEENHKREILEFCDNRKDLIRREIEIVNLNEVAKEKCMNQMVGGVGGFISEEQQRNRSSAGGKAYAEKLKNNEKFRYNISKKLSKIASRSWKNGKYNNRIKQYWWIGRKHKKETIELMKKSHKGKHIGNLNSQYGTCWIYFPENKINKKIKNKELKKYINNGWVRGRI